MHCSRRRLPRRVLEFHVCTINKSAHTKKVRKLIVCTSYFQCVTVILIFSLLKQQRCERILLSPSLVQGLLDKTLKSRSLTALCHNQQKSLLYNYLFCFQLGLYHQRPLIKSSTINSIHFYFLLPPNSETLYQLLWGRCLYTTSGSTATTRLRPLSSLITYAFCLFPPQGDGSFLLMWFIHRHFQN